MAKSWIDLRASDRMELENLAGSVVADVVAETRFRVVDAVFESIVDLKSFSRYTKSDERKLKIVIEALIEEVVTRFAAFSVEDFVDAVGNREWELLPPASARYVEGVLSEIFAQKSTASEKKSFSNSLSSVKVRRGPRRVRKLRRSK